MVVMGGEAGGGLYPDSAEEAVPDPSAILAGIRERYRESFAALPGFTAAPGTPWEHINSADDVPLLLAAVEAVLKLADEWETEGGRLYGFDDRASRTFEECAEGLREAITSALTGKEGSEDE